MRSPAIKKLLNLGAAALNEDDQHDDEKHTCNNPDNSVWSICDSPFL